VSRNGRRKPPRPRIELTTPLATAEESAAIAAAIERFLEDTAPSPQPAEPVSGWQRAALIDGVSAKRRSFPPDPGAGFPVFVRRG
jgi:hypothetical protein